MVNLLPISNISNIQQYSIESPKTTSNLGIFIRKKAFWFPTLHFLDYGKVQLQLKLNENVSLVGTKSYYFPVWKAFQFLPFCKGMQNVWKCPVQSSKSRWTLSSSDSIFQFWNMKLKWNKERFYLKHEAKEFVLDPVHNPHSSSQ